MKRSETEIFDASLDQFFEGVSYFVEADSMSRLACWQHWTSPKYFGRSDKDWKQKTGTAVTIGHIARRPICVELFPIILGGRMVMFYNGCSQLVDHAMIEDFIKMTINRFKVTTKDGRFPMCNADNFHHCVHTLDDISK